MASSMAHMAICGRSLLTKTMFPQGCGSNLLTSALARRCANDLVQSKVVLSRARALWLPQMRSGRLYIRFFDVIASPPCKISEVTRVQFPVRPAMACMFNRAQGSTLSVIAMDYREMPR
jgi:hypothetical protein